MTQRIRLSLSEDIIEMLDQTCQEMKITRSKAITSILIEHEKQQHSEDAINYRKIVKELSEMKDYIKDKELIEFWTPKQKQEIFEFADSYERFLRQHLKRRIIK